MLHENGDKTKFGIVGSVDPCRTCKFEGACDDEVWEYCKENLYGEQNFKKLYTKIKKIKWEEAKEQK